MTTFPIGKLPAPVLARMLAENRIDDPRVLVGPKVGEDATVIDFGDPYLVAKTDPITFATDRNGWYAVNINATDIATMGARPQWFLITILLPEGQATDELVQGIFEDIRSACDELNVSLCGGHTEITYGLSRPIVVGQMLGGVPRSDLVQNENAQPGDVVILTNGIAIEATAIIALEKPDEVKQRFGEPFLERARTFLSDPGISVVEAALAANGAAPIAAMHDPTEGGLATGLMELAEVSSCGIEVDLDEIRIWPESRQLCDAFGLDPLGAIASGALLVVCSPSESQPVLAVIEGAGVQCSVIGKKTAPAAGPKIRPGGKLTPPPRVGADENAKSF